MLRQLLVLLTVNRAIRTAISEHNAVDNGLHADTPQTVLIHVLANEPDAIAGSNTRVG